MVIEKNATANQKGRPVAFIEAAWRRYTKHSRNKVQEIQGAILPIADGYEWDKPFLGAVLAGVFTSASIEQLKSVGFHVLYFPYESIVAAFASVEINVRFDETTPDEDFKACVEKIESLSQEEYEVLKGYLAAQKEDLFRTFLDELAGVLDRMIERLIVIPLFGDEYEFTSITDALKFIGSFTEGENGGEFRKYEVIVKFSNGDKIDASFNTKRETEKFLRYVAE